MRLPLLALVLLLPLAPASALSQSTSENASQSQPAPDSQTAPDDGPMNGDTNTKSFDFVIEDGATHRPLANTPVTVTLTAPDGSATQLSPQTTADGKITLDLDPAAKYSLGIHADGYADLKQALDPALSAGTPVFSLQTVMGATIHAVLVQLFFALLPVAAFFLLREAAVRAVHRFMMRSGSEQPPPALAEEPGPPPATAPAFLEMNSLNGVLLNGAAQARLERAETTSRRKLNIFLLSLVVQVCALAAAVALIAWLQPKVLQEVLMQIGIGAGVLLGIDVLLGFYAWTTWLQGLRLTELLAAVSSLAAVAITLVGLRSELPVLLVLPALAQIAYLLQEFRALRRAAKQDGNRKLVILRVFGSDKNTAFTFGRLMEQWRFIGSFLTIVDPAYIRYKFTVLKKGGLGNSLGTLLTLGTLAALLDNAVKYLSQLYPQFLPASWASLPPEALLTRVRAIAYLVLSVLAVLPMLVYIWRRFLKSPAQAAAGVERIRRSGLSLETDFHGSPFFCYDDVWRPAVRKMLAAADVVLMDLRGFSEKRQGSAYELGELVDFYPVDRLLFLVDAATPRPLLQELILDRWSKMRAESPNRAIREPIIQLFETGNQVPSDIRHIAGLLSASLEGSVRAHAQLTYWSAPAERVA